MQRLIHLGLLITPLICYLEWGTDQSGFLLEMEYSLLTKGEDLLQSLFHPFIILPLSGQLLLIITLFQKQPSKKLALVSVISMGLLVLMVLLTGVLSRNPKVVLSTLPFLLVSFLFIRTLRKKKQVVTP